jgi:anthranilate/para-aminobenzoate synthase component II
LVEHDAKGVFKDIPNPFMVMRYHSLVLDEKSILNDIYVTAKTKDGIVMGIRHKKFPLEGIQFHPESILTEYGKTLVKNFLNQA